ncbi:glycine betaine/L-proline ABC transporter substrate-binding protein ProX [Martelella mediterranea]|uniref:Glycine betaine/proline transport system substrate-binding protein n=1 Tax=Martelella mediterranea TaxID=293089 RepID=A0A4R3P1G3_9HYPH|nr:glycine betaine/L-proline ABC transporter substrate-binding protein ProX [Martelella mediterranea]TCT43079.1 glycine betaine/proline transport system substrate-binding protein [Martelella mediterranea]
MISFKHSSAIAGGVLAFANLVSAPQFAMADDARPGEGVSITIAQANDDTGWIITEVYSQLLAELGYDMQEPLNSNIPVAYQAVSQGSADFYYDGWLPLHNVYLNQPGFNAKPIGYVVKQGALQGYLVDKASADKFDIKTLDDFKRDDVKEAFDRNGDGKADLVACPPGWGCELTIKHQLDAFELRDDINPIKAGYSASMADAIAAYSNDEPILFYTWTPNWTVNELKPGEDVVWIQTPSVSLPEEQEDLKDSATVEGIKGCVADPCRLGWPINDIRIVANNDFIANNPVAAKFLEEASLPIEFIYKQNAAMKNGANTPADLQKQAADWISANRDTVDGWLDDARSVAQ